MSGSGDLQPNSGLRYHTDADSPLPETINPIIDAVESHLAESANKHIKDSGSNDFGYWVEYDNGEMECWGSISVTTAAGGWFSFTFPRAFTSDYIFVSVSPGYSARDTVINVYGLGGGVRAEGYVYGVGGAAKVSFAFTGRYYARGRWK